MIVGLQGADGDLCTVDAPVKPRWHLLAKRNRRTTRRRSAYDARDVVVIHKTVGQTLHPQTIHYNDSRRNGPAPLTATVVFHHHHHDVLVSCFDPCSETLWTGVGRFWLHTNQLTHVSKVPTIERESDTFPDIKPSYTL